uniref:Uncharacterized protein n=1 Tax=Brassica campestris TaxID=3711 RepID=M4CVG1_BRACM
MPEGLKDAEKCIELDRAFSMGYSRKKQEERLHRRSSSPDEKPSSSLLTSFVLLGLFGGLLVRSRGSHIRWQRLLPGVTGRLRVSKIWHIFQFKPVFNGKLKLQR